jgi:toxin ParE1/3/4
MPHRVLFHPAAWRELIDIHDYIAAQAGPARAAKFAGEIRDYCLGLADVPERGTRRDDIAPGARLVGFRRRVSIVFKVDDATVTIVGIYYGGRNIAPLPDDV